jgi:hypothetical protein
VFAALPAAGVEAVQAWPPAPPPPLVTAQTCAAAKNVQEVAEGAVAAIADDNVEEGHDASLAGLSE